MNEKNANNLILKYLNDKLILDSDFLDLVDFCLNLENKKCDRQMLITFINLGLGTQMMTWCINCLKNHNKYTIIKLITPEFTIYFND